MRNTSIESAKNSSSFASTESAAKKTFKVNVHYLLNGENAVVCENRKGDYVGVLVTTRYADAVEYCDYGTFVGSKDACINWCKNQGFNYSVIE